ncbi:MAG: hypothetical protein LWX09_02505 [Bacteroidia bacterium]|nr:hypothetical protein [Bacteroidia bacterium]
MRNRVIILVFPVFFTLLTSAQELPKKGVPLLRNFTPAQYENKGKIWDITSAPNGIVYMAADKGLIEFDGMRWNSFKGSNGFTRSVLVVSDSLIYTGSDLDFGYWKRNSNQEFNYTSLYPFRNDTQDVNEEFWNTFLMGEDIVFVSSNNIYVYKRQQLIRINAPTRFAGSFVVNDSLFLADAKNGLYLFEKASLKQLAAYPDNAPFEISGMYPWNNGKVIVTKSSGLYFYSSGKLNRLANPLSEMLKTANVFSFAPIGSHHLAFGTVLNGLYICDYDGIIVHQFNRYKGLLSNTILSLHYSRNGKLWVGSDYGVSSLFLRNNTTYFYDYRGDFGTGYTAQVKDDVFYLGTNQGLYRSDWEALSNDKKFTSFELVPGTEGQVWTLEMDDNTLLMGHDRGLFEVGKNYVKRIDQQTEGVWTISTYRGYLITGNYNGISIFRKANGEWSFVKKMDLIYGSCNQLVFQGFNVLWINIPNFGIIRAVLDENLYPVERLIFPDSLFSGTSLWIARENLDIQVFTDKFKYSYDPGSSTFVQHAEPVIMPRVENLLSGIYSSAPLHRDYEFYPVYNGFAFKYLRDSGVQQPIDYSLLIRKAEALSHNSRISILPGNRLPYRFNSVRFQFIVPNQNDVVYQYKLNENGEWSAWSPEPFAEIAGLWNNSYTLYVNAGLDGRIIAQSSFEFSIAPPWYRSWYAYLSYVVLFMLAAYLIQRWQSLLLKKQKKSLLIKEQNSLRQQAEKHREQILVLEQECLKAEFNQVKQQLRAKTIELANKAKDNEDKNRLLLSLKEKFDLLESDPESSKVRLNEIRRLLNSYLNTDDKTFEIQMDELHQEFFKKLKEKFPTLSGNDLRLCAYLRVGLNSKEIAEILNIQPSSSYISRSRLRKKLNLKMEDDLYDFLNNI